VPFLNPVAFAEPFERVTRPPRFEEMHRHVLRARGFLVPAHTERLHLQQRRPLATPGAIGCLSHIPSLESMSLPSTIRPGMPYPPTHSAMCSTAMTSCVGVESP
jgi:hypothetical protein